MPLSNPIPFLLQKLGKGPGMMALAFTELILAYFLAKGGVDLNPYAVVIGAINVPVFGGGAWKAAAEAKNGRKS
jgi:hypothetical protein